MINDAIKLKAARDLILDPKKWSYKALARDAAGVRCSVRSSEAVCWCGLGALLKVTDNDPRELYSHLNLASYYIFSAKITYVNDYHGHDAVMRAYALAIERAETSKG